MLSKQLENKFNEIILERINGNPDRLRQYVKSCSKKNLIKLFLYINNNYYSNRNMLNNTIRFALNID